MPTFGSMGELQVGEIHAGDEKHGTDSAEQNEQAVKEDEERWAKIAKGEEVPEDDDEDEDDDEEDFDLVDDLEEAEVFPGGEDLAIAIAEDLWTNALKYYGESFHSFDTLFPSASEVSR